MSILGRQNSMIFFPVGLCIKCTKLFYVDRKDVFFYMQTCNKLILHRVYDTKQFSREHHYHSNGLVLSNIIKNIKKRHIISHAH